MLYLTYELKRMVAGPGCYIAVIDLLKPSKLRILGCYVVITTGVRRMSQAFTWMYGMGICNQFIESRMGAGPGCWGI